MSQIALTPNASGTGTFSIASPNSNTDRTLTLPDATTTVVGTDVTQTLTNKTIAGGAITRATPVASTSGTDIDFTSIPSWAKRVTVMFSGVSTNGTSSVQVQLGTSGGFISSGYLGTNMAITGTGVSALISTGFSFSMASQDVAAAVRHGQMVFTNITGNTWVGSGHLSASHAVMTSILSGAINLSDVLDRVRITTVNGTDTFDAGTINILYEG